MNKVQRLALLTVGSLVLATAGWKSFTAPASLHNTPALSAPAAAQTKQANVSILTGSAKEALLRDPDIAKVLADHGLTVSVTKTSSVDADRVKAPNFDIVWPAGSNAAKDLSLPKSAATSIFFSPLAFASWAPIQKILAANGVIDSKSSNVVQLSKLLPLMTSSTRWNQLKDASDHGYALNRSVLVNTPDIRRSNTGLLYLSLLAFELNNSTPLSNEADVATYATKLAPLISRQGFQEDTLTGPFEDYLGIGMGKAPIVLVYESQFLEAKASGKLPTGANAPTLLYPSPTLFIKHVMLSNTPTGARLAKLFAEDPTIRKILSERYGYRLPNMADKTKPDLTDVADEPTSAVLATFLTALNPAR